MEYIPSTCKTIYRRQVISMIVIYHDVGGTHSAAVAANIHINRLPIDSVPNKEELLKLSTFDKIDKKALQRIIYIGDDEFGSKVYTIGCRYKTKIIIPVIEDIYNILKSSNNELILVSTQPTVNTLMKIGGFTSRQLNMVAIGRPIVTYGTLKAYKDIADIVKNVKQRIQKSYHES